MTRWRNDEQNMEKRWKRDRSAALRQLYLCCWVAAVFYNDDVASTVTQGDISSQKKDEPMSQISSMTSMRELNADELDVVAGGQSVVGGSGSVVDITATGAAVDGILGAVGSLVNGAVSTGSSSGTGLLGGGSGLLGGLL